MVIVGTRKALDYVACCGDAGKVHDITAATFGDAYDTERFMLLEAANYLDVKELVDVVTGYYADEIFRRKADMEASGTTKLQATL